MTSLAYIHDCHCCYDERSIDQKKHGFNAIFEMDFWVDHFEHHDQTNCRRGMNNDSVGFRNIV